MKKKILNIAAVLLVAVIIGVTAQGVYAKISWNIAYKEYQNRNVITKSIALEENAPNNYSENLNMDYIYQDKIGIKLNSIMITNDYCQIGFDIKLEEEISKWEEKIRYGIAVYDENNNIYILHGWKHEESLYWKKLYQELGLKRNNMKNILNDSASFGVSKLTMTSKVGFPKSKKLYVRMFDIGYEDSKIDSKTLEEIYHNDIYLSDSEWQFEIDIPEKFYERTEVELKLSEDVQGIKLNKAELTQTALTINIEIDQIREFLMAGKDMGKEEFDKLRNAVFYISDEDENIYMAMDLGIDKGNEINARFGIGKEMLNKKLFLNVSLNDIQKKVELIQK
ncbi:MAG: hypothetical protein HFJ27_02560 [Clostridia bacterium]|nr:hypothetical protein [Clostridia bacterium]